MTMTPSERKMRARVAAHTSWANTADRTERTAAGRRAMDEKFEREVDPDGTLAPEERARRAESARKAHFARLALLSAEARRRKKADSASGEPATGEWETIAMPRDPEGRTIRQRWQGCEPPGPVGSGVGYLCTHFMWKLADDGVWERTIWAWRPELAEDQGHG